MRALGYLVLLGSCIALASSCSDDVTTTDDDDDSTTTSTTSTGTGGDGGSTGCSGTLVDCGGECVDTQTDPAHCGACDEPCDPATQECSAGGCVCADPYEDCGAGCIDTDTSAEHCGGCDQPCDPDTEECSDGGCSCVAPYVDCGGDCIDPDSDDMYCGATGDCQGDNAGEQCDPVDGSCDSGVCTCPAPLVHCDGACINPAADPLFCGASGSCQGAEAGIQCVGSETCSASLCVDTCDNCGFELGDFTSWTTQDIAGAFWPLTVGQAGVTSGFGFFTSAPTEGTYAALHGFDGAGPGTIEFGQDITIAPAASASLDFDYQAGWEMTPWGATLDRTFTVHIEPPGGGVPLYSELILTAVAGTDNYDTGALAGAVDVSAYAGQQVYVRFVWDVPETMTGPAFFQVDNVRVSNP